jgi:hypothetical protein
MLSGMYLLQLVAAATSMKQIVDLLPADKSN